MKFDIHCHVFEKKGFPRPDGNFYLIPEECLKMFEEKGVARGVILPEAHYDATPTVQNVEEAARICKAYPDRFYFFMNLDPRSFYINPKADYSELIEYYLDMGARGVGELCANFPWDHPLMDNMLFYINQYKLPLTFHMTHSEYCDYGVRDDERLSGLERCARKYPDITFLCHSEVFWAEISGDEYHAGYPQGPVLPGGRVVELMRELPNLCGDLSAGSGLNALRRDRKFGLQFMEEFQDRLFFGQDFCSPTDGPDLVLSEYLDELLAEHALSREVYDKICWKNAVKLLNLPLTEVDFQP